MIKLNRQDLILGLSKTVLMTGNIANDILSCILLESNKDSLYISATNFETAARIKVPANGSQKFKTCVHGKKFFEIIKNLDEDIEISVNGNLFISSGKSKFKLNTVSYNEFPDVLKITDYSFVLSIRKEDFLEGINKVSFAISSEQQNINYNLECICIHLLPGQIRFIGTDGHRLAILKKEIEGESEGKFLVFNKYLKDIKNFIIGSQLETVQVYFSKEKIMIETENGYMLVRLTEGKFPDYEAVIPSYNSYVKVKKNNLLKSVKRASIIDEYTKTVILSTGNNLLKVEAVNQEMGSVYEEVDSENYIDITLGINARYLIEGLERTENEEVKIYMQEPTRAIYFGDNNFTYILMPVRL